MPTPKRPHVQTVRLTTNQRDLLKLRASETPGLSIQKVLTTAVSAFIRGDFVVRADGSYTLRESGVISFEDDADAVDLTSLGESEPEVWGTREIAEHAARMTGRRVSIHLLRVLLREEFPKPEGAGKQARYRFSSDSPEVTQIIKRVGEGALDAIREKRIENL